MVGEDLVSPALQCPAERSNLRNSILAAALDGLVQQHLGGSQIVGEINVSDRFLGHPRAEDFVIGVAEP